MYYIDECYKNRAERIYVFIDGTMTIEEILKTAIRNFNINVNNREKYTVLERMLKSYIEYLNETGRIELNIDDGFFKYSKHISKPFHHLLLPGEETTLNKMFLRWKLASTDVHDFPEYCNH